MDAPVDNNQQAMTTPEYVLHELEGRVHSLETAVARLEDTGALEQRVIARLTDRLPQAKVAADRDSGVDSGVIEERVLARLAGRMPPPTAAPPMPEGAAPRDAEPPPPSAWGGRWASWLLVDMFREAKLLVTMIADRRYQMAWTTRIVALIFLPAILTTHWWLPLAWLPAVGGLFVNLVNLVLAFALYKALSREARRYDERLRR